MKKNALRAALLAVWLLAALLLLSGCTGEPTERAGEDMTDHVIESGVPAPAEDAFSPYEQEALLYFLKEDAAALAPVMAKIEVPGEKSPAEAALGALMTGKADGRLFWPEIGDGWRFELCRSIATVDLPARARALTQEELFAVRQAIASTLCGFPEIAYVNVLVGGREEGMDLGATYPLGTLARPVSMELAAMYGREDEKRLGGSFSARATLYFPTEDGSLLIPEARTISFGEVSTIEYLYVLLEELGKGGRDPLACQELPAPMDYIEEMPEIIRTEDGANRVIDIRFADELDEALANAGLSRGIYLAMLTDTLMGFVPGVEGVRMSVGRECLTSLAAEETPDGRAIEFSHTQATRADFTELSGAVATYYVRSGSRLSRAEGVLPQKRQREPRARLEGLLAAEQSALPEGLGPEDILAAALMEDVIAVNLSERFAQRLSEMTPLGERLAVFAMVNTLTEDMPQQKVCFFFEGEQPSQLAGGVEFRGSFTRSVMMAQEE